VGDLSILGVDEEEHVGRTSRRRKKRRRPWIAPTAIIVAILMIATGGFFGGRAVWHQTAAVPDYEGQGAGTVYVQIEPGDSAVDIGQRLYDQGVVKSVRAFRKAAEDDDRSLGLQPGTYELHQHMSAAAALTMLLDPSSVVGRVSVPEGMNVAETFDFLAKHTDITVAQFEAAAKNPSGLGLPDYANGKVDGFLFPTTYDIPRDATAADVLKMMIAQYNARIAPATVAAKIPGLNLTPMQILVVASLLEKEGITDDFSKIARVIYNRLEAGKPLQLDSTIVYALGHNVARVTNEQIKIDSPYNTYIHTGLPPGPISNPGLTAIDAALSPADGDWMYFVKANKDGHSFFTSDPNAFQAQKEKSQQEGIY